MEREERRAAKLFDDVGRDPQAPKSHPPSDTSDERLTRALEALRNWARFSEQTLAPRRSLLPDHPSRRLRLEIIENGERRGVVVLTRRKFTLL